MLKKTQIAFTIGKVLFFGTLISSISFILNAFLLFYIESEKGSLPDFITHYFVTFFFKSCTEPLSYIFKKLKLIIKQTKNEHLKKKIKTKKLL